MGGAINKNARFHKKPSRDPKRKAAFRVTLAGLIQAHTRVMLVNVDNVGSAQLQKVRAIIRGKGDLVFGKNTQIRAVLNGLVTKNPVLQSLISLVSGNIGFLFTQGDMKVLKDAVTSIKVAAPARTGSIAPVDVHLQPGPTGLDPGQTHVFQSLAITTKIAKGVIEIVSPVHLIKKGQKVSASEAALLSKLNIMPFSYNVNPIIVWENGQTYSPDVLDITDEVLLGRVSSGLQNIAAASLQLKYPTALSIPFAIADVSKNLFGAAMVVGFKHPLVDAISKAAAAAPAKAAASSSSSSSAPAKAAPVAAAPAKPAPPAEEEGNFDMGGLF